MSRLVEETFTADEVSDMLEGLQAVVRGEVEMELINTSHTNVLLLRQLFSQAEKYYLKLQTDVSELENRWEWDSAEGTGDWGSREVQLSCRSKCMIFLVSVFVLSVLILCRVNLDLCNI